MKDDNYPMKDYYHIKHPSMQINPTFPVRRDDMASDDLTENHCGPGNNQYDLQSFSDEQLEHELKRRSRKRKNIPKPILHPNYNNLKNKCWQYLVDLAEGNPTNGYESGITDIVLETLYCPKVFDWIKEQSQ